MSYSLNKLPNEPIIHIELNGDYDLIGGEGAQAISDLLDAQDEPVYLIIHLMVQADLEAMMVSASRAARGENAILHHPNVRQTLFVCDDSPWEMAVDGLQNEIFGSPNLALFSTVKEALDYARGQ